MRISAAFRLALFAKGLLLLGFALLFGALLIKASERHFAVLAISAVFFGVPCIFCGWTAWLALADAALGRAVVVAGAVALTPRRLSGISFRTPDRRSAEFVLYNTWSPLVPEHRYTITIGRFSRVLVAPHVEEV